MNSYEKIPQNPMSAPSYFFVTGNFEKFREMREFIPNLEQLDFNLSKIQAINGRDVIRAKIKEIFENFEERCLERLSKPFINPEEKSNFGRVAEMAKSAINDGNAKIIVEDTSLYFAAYSEKETYDIEPSGLPGPLIKWFLKLMGNPGLYKFAMDAGNVRSKAVTLIACASSKENVTDRKSVV